MAPETSDEGPASTPACNTPMPPARSSITIAFGAEVRMTIEGAPDASTLAAIAGFALVSPRGLIANALQPDSSLRLPPLATKWCDQWASTRM
jgi:hypothetical protein